MTTQSKGQSNRFRSRSRNIKDTEQGHRIPAASVNAVRALIGLDQRKRRRGNKASRASLAEPNIRTRRRQPFPEGSDLAILDRIVGMIVLQVRAAVDAELAGLRGAIEEALGVIDEALR